MRCVCQGSLACVGWHISSNMALAMLMSTGSSLGPPPHSSCTALEVVPDMHAVYLLRSLVLRLQELHQTTQCDWLRPEPHVPHLAMALWSDSPFVCVFTDEV